MRIIGFLPALIDSQWHLDFPELDGALAGARRWRRPDADDLDKIRHFAALGYPYASSANGFAIVTRQSILTLASLRCREPR
ncbi:MAG TPA: hypothetical protein VFP29_02430 [Methyloceanibacter sp.]|nr:hypothetical protein [Methyloceanibacter sp.]